MLDIVYNMLGWIIANDVDQEVINKLAFHTKDTPFEANENIEQVVPAWTAFNSQLKKDEVPPITNIGYCPMVDASTT